MAQKIPVKEFYRVHHPKEKRQHKYILFAKNIICKQCTKKKDREYICSQNNVKSLNLKDNTCPYFKAKEEEEKDE